MIHSNFYIRILVLRRNEELNDRIWYEFNLASKKCVFRTKISSEKFIHYGKLSQERIYIFTFVYLFIIRFVIYKGNIIVRRNFANTLFVWSIIERLKD